MKEDHRGKVDRLFRAHGRAVGGYVLARTGNPDAAEEITARIFLQAVRKVHQQHEHAAGWLWAIVRSEIASYFRRKDRFVPLHDEHAAPMHSVDDEEEKHLLHARLRQALERLPEEQQRIVFLKFFEQMRNQDISAASGLSPSHVGVLVHRAIKQLRNLMGDPSVSPELSHE